MAKKPTAAQPALVHIPTTASDALSKEQKAFNRLSKRIGKLETEIGDFRTAATVLRQRVQQEYRPLQQQHNDLRAQFVRMLDRAHDTYKLTKTERKKLVNLLLNGFFDLLDRGYDDLEAIFDKYDPPLTDQEAAEAEAANAAADAREAELMKDFFQEQYGIEFDPEADVSTPEKLQNYVNQQLADRQQDYERQAAAAEERRPKRKKSPKQQAAADKKKAEEQNITQSVRTLYMDLVKHLHPDREPDEAEKLRKTELLKRVTTAYKANELLTLLRLQLELNRIDQQHLENLAEAQLRHYNTLLRQQVRELEQQQALEQRELSAFTGKPYYYTASPAAMELDFQHMKAGLTAKVQRLETDVERCGQDPAALKEFLKAYRILKTGNGPLLMRF
ncbi:hypothetical protein CDA63_06645 [Hymenobacter amundsenii]|uniref:Molecular chaperone DnaJ n=1 Tax=Hymenobacter amundsenii TaxID=2006685 RepID=A0A246FMA0_9BACT|nr:hypothetical protein [Hymenobacter amundsenii]OWP63886.1 hypothetical protein CDA63_06645 [Hymenobacter amundsenii]